MNPDPRFDPGWTRHTDRICAASPCRKAGGGEAVKLSTTSCAQRGNQRLKAGGK